MEEVNMSPHLGKTNFDEDELAALRVEANAFIEREQWTRRRFAEESDVAEGTFGPWLDGKYQGNNAGPAAKVYRFLQARKDQAALAAQIPTAPCFQETKTARRILAALDHAQVFGDLVVVGCGPGLGKSAALAQFKATRPRVIVATMAPSTRGVNTALVEVLAAMGDAEARGTPQALSRRIATKATAGALLAIDEAQHLSQQAVDELRSIHDRTGVGVVFSGDESVFTLFDGTRRAAFAQFHSRIGMRVRQSRPDPSDAPILARAHGVNDSQSIKLLTEISLKPGGLRGMTKTLLLARRMSALASTPLTASLIREAWAQRSPDMAA
jgi:DNA transposition AAA+ family ATPase